MATDPRIYGTDFDVDLSLLDLKKSPQAGIAHISGEANVASAILRRLSTPLGDLPAHPTYGNRAWAVLESPMDAEWPGRLESAIADCLSQEPRILLSGRPTVRITPGTGNVSVTIRYKLRATMSERDLVWDVNLAAVRRSAGA